MRAAVFHGPRQPLTIEEVDIAKPIAREVLVRTVASGVCHSDLHYVDGTERRPPGSPAVLPSGLALISARAGAGGPVFSKNTAADLALRLPDPGILGNKA
jgi:S-(hydroxymethyl)glutathione dehydrogenase/alcohol dehydrogenase